jgi:hypothetical protein
MQPVNQTVVAGQPALRLSTCFQQVPPASLGVPEATDTLSHN